MCLCEPNQAQKTLHLHSRVGGGWGNGGVSCGVSSFDNLTFSTGPLQTHHGELFPLRTLPLRGGSQRQDGAGRWGVCLHDASCQVKIEKSAHYLLSFNYQNKRIQFYSFHLKLMDNEMQDQPYVVMQFKASGKALSPPPQLSCHQNALSSTIRAHGVKCSLPRSHPLKYKSTTGILYKTRIEPEK